MIPDVPPDTLQDNAQSDPQDNPGTQTTIPTTEEGNTPVDERYRMTGQEAGSEVSPGSEPDSHGAASKVIGAPNQGTDSR